MIFKQNSEEVICEFHEDTVNICNIIMTINIFFIHAGFLVSF